MPRSAQIYLFLSYFWGRRRWSLPTTFPSSRVPVNGRELILFLILAALASGKKIRLGRQRAEAEGRQDGEGAMSLEFAISFAAMLRFGLVGAVPVALVGALGTVLFPKRQPLYQAAFNLALTTLEAWTSTVVFLLLNGGQPAHRSEDTLLAVAASILCAFAVNTGGISLIIALCTGQRPTTVWKENFLWTGPSYFAGGAASTLAVFLMGPSHRRAPGLPGADDLHHLPGLLAVRLPRGGKAEAAGGEPAAHRVDGRPVPGDRQEPGAGH